MTYERGDQRDPGIERHTLTGAPPVRNGPLAESEFPDARKKGVNCVVGTSRASLGNHFREARSKREFGEHKRRLAQRQDGGGSTIILAEITVAKVTSLVAKDLSGVDAGQSHPGRVCSPDPGVNGLS